MKVDMKRSEFVRWYNRCRYARDPGEIANFLGIEFEPEFPPVELDRHYNVVRSYSGDVVLHLGSKDRITHEMVRLYQQKYGHGNSADNQGETK